MINAEKRFFLNSSFCIPHFFSVRSVAKCLIMSAINFPNPSTHHFVEWVAFGEYYYNARDIVCFGGRLTTENLRNAYARGIFPWTIEGLPLPWFCPEQRAILEFSELRVPKSLRRVQKKNPFTFTIDKAFREVITICGNIKRAHEAGTWITRDFIESYTQLHLEGEAHSVEVWEAGELVGGLYGVDAGGVFAGESMFYKRPNASKLALLFLIEHLQSRGATWLDAQVMTPHLEALGAREIWREDFLEKLRRTQARNLRLFKESDLILK
jgi:leucyl/phenylalanyl-tRNA---protein transferase